MDVASMTDVELSDGQTFTDAGFIDACQPPDQISSVDFSDCPQLTSVGFAHISRLVNLRQLRASGSPFGDEHITYLLELPELYDLTLDGTPISAAGIRTLAQMPKLWHLVVDIGSLEFIEALETLVQLTCLTVHIEPNLLESLGFDADGLKQRLQRSLPTTEIKVYAW